MSVALGALRAHVIRGLLTHARLLCKDTENSLRLQLRARYIVLTERISMDLNGAIVKHEVRDAPTYAPSYDVGLCRYRTRSVRFPIAINIREHPL
jgi:hypothetical protein